MAQPTDPSAFAAAGSPGHGSQAGDFVQLANGQWVPSNHPLAQAEAGAGAGDGTGAGGGGAVLPTDPTGGAGTDAGGGSAADPTTGGDASTAALQQLAAAAQPNEGNGQERAVELQPGLTMRDLPASSLALSQLAASRGGRVY